MTTQRHLLVEHIDVAYSDSQTLREKFATKAQAHESCKYQLLPSAIAAFDPEDTSAADWDGAFAGATWTADAAAHVRLLNQATNTIYTLTSETTCTPTGETALHGAQLVVTDSGRVFSYRDTAATGAATLALVNVESLVRTAALDMGGYAVTNFANESGAIVDLHSPGGATVLLSSTFAAEKALGYLTASHKYFAVMSARIFLWKTANPDTVVGWIDLPPIGMRISTDASNVATVAFNRSASDIAYSWDCYNGLMGDALPLAAAGLLPLLAASTGGFTISLTEAAGLACTAKCVGRWINRLELLV